jgi:hypothetical protein
VVGAEHRADMSVRLTCAASRLSTRENSRSHANRIGYLVRSAQRGRMPESASEKGRTPVVVKGLDRYSPGLPQPSDFFGPSTTNLSRRMVGRVLRMRLTPLRVTSFSDSHGGVAALAGGARGAN